MAAASVVILSSSPGPSFAGRRPCSPAFPSPFSLPRKRDSGGADNQRFLARAHNKSSAVVENASKSLGKYGEVLDTPFVRARSSKQETAPRDKLRSEVETLGKSPGLKRRKSTKRDVSPPKGGIRGSKSADDQSQIKKGKITKPIQSTKRGKISEKTKRSTGLVSGHFQSIDDFPADSPLPLNTAAQEVAAKKSLPRRTSWTPPRETPDLVDRFGDSGQGGGWNGQTDEVVDGAKLVANLCRSFGYSESAGNANRKSANAPGSGKLVNKKRRIEIIQSATSMVEKSPLPLPKPTRSRTKAPKKKPNTITAQATAQYVTEHPLPSASLLPHLQIQPGHFLEPDSNNITISHAVSRKAATGSASAGRSTKNADSTPASLPAPEVVLRDMKDQGFLFGTSSQLAAESSPTTIRQLQEAIRESESMVDLQRSSNASPTRLGKRSAPSTSGARSFAGKRKLWSAASRGDNDALLEREEVDLTESPITRASQADSKLLVDDGSNVSTIQTEVLQPVNEADSCDCIDENPTDAKFDAKEQSAKLLKQSRVIEAVEAPASEVDQLSSISKTKSLNKRQPKARSTKIEQSKSGTNEPSKSSTQFQKPDFDGYTTAQLSKEVQAYGFKAIKNRKQMVSLLGRCWEGKHKTILQSAESNPSVDTTNRLQADGDPTACVAKGKKPATISGRGTAKKQQDAELGSQEPKNTALGSPKRPRGRPRKTALNSEAQNPADPIISSKQTTPRKPRKIVTTRPITTVIEEISDSDTPPTPSPPRRRCPTSPTLPLQLGKPPGTAHQNNTTTRDPRNSIATPEDLSPSDRQARLFKQITDAIRAEPKSSARSWTTAPPPTWHEKILLYDPIILEDLAAWLNTEGLGRIGVDEEVSAYVVRAWCEERGVCCLWKVNLRGGVRSRF
ncbi:MAG: 5'-flap endonuclease [Sclerophora amabilis]|nr:MAG: 5'-flap endonuclease [Sclerophora amabilis]